MVTDLQRFLARDHLQICTTFWRKIQGLTTAASVLLCAAVGISVALRQFVLALGVTVLALIVLRGLTGVEKRIAKKKKA